MEFIVDLHEIFTWNSNENIELQVNPVKFVNEYVKTQFTCKITNFLVQGIQIDFDFWCVSHMHEVKSVFLGDSIFFNRQLCNFYNYKKHYKFK